MDDVTRKIFAHLRLGRRQISPAPSAVRQSRLPRPIGTQKEAVPNFRQHGPLYICLMTGFPPRRFSLRKRSARLGLNERNVRTVDEAISGYIFAEVGSGHRLTRLGLGLANVGGVDEAIGRRIAEEHAHCCRCRGGYAASAAVYAGQSRGDILCVANAREIHGVLVRIWSDVGAANCPARRDGGVVNASHVLGETQHNSVIAICTAASTFDSTCARKRQVNVKCAYRIMGFARCGSDQSWSRERTRAGNLVVVPFGGNWTRAGAG